MTQELKSPAALHGFLTGLYKKVDDPEIKEKALLVTDQFLVDYRSTTRSFLFDETQIPGYKSFVMAWQPTALPSKKARDDIHSPRHAMNIKFMGVREDGRIAGGKINIQAHLDEGSLGLDWTKNRTEDDPYKAVALIQARALAKALSGEAPDIQDSKELSRLKGWEWDDLEYSMKLDTDLDLYSEDNLDLDNDIPIEYTQPLPIEHDLPLPLNARGGKAYAYAKENQRTANWALKSRLRDAGLITYKNPEDEDRSNHIYSGIHKFCAAVMQQERRSANYMAASLTRQLDPDALKIARSINDVTPESLNYLMGQPIDAIARNDLWAIPFDFEGDDDDYHASKDGKENFNAYDSIPVSLVTPQTPEDSIKDNKTRRQQALKAYPVLAGRIMRTTGFTNLIDRGEPLADELSKNLNLTSAHLKRLQGQSWQRTGRSVYMDPDKLTLGIGKSAVDHIPTDKKGWKSLTRAYELAYEYGTIAGVFSHDVFADLKGRYDVIEKTAQNHVPGGLDDAGRHIAQHLTRAATALYLSQKGLDEDTIKTWLGNGEDFKKQGPTGQGASLRQAIETADKWHRIQGPFDAAMLPEQKEKRPWPTLPVPEQIEDTQIVPLNSSRDLQQEGLKQNHCVGGYTNQCLSGDSLILSIRKDKTILSTIEFSIEKDEKSKNGFKFPIRQNMAKGNHTASKTAKDIGNSLQKHLAQLDKNTILTWQKNLQEEQQKRRKEKTTLKDQVGYDPLDKGKVAQAYTFMRPALPKSWAKKSFEQWMEQTIKPFADKKYSKLIDKHTAKETERG